MGVTWTVWAELVTSGGHWAGRGDMSFGTPDLGFLNVKNPFYRYLLPEDVFFFFFFFFFQSGGQ